MELKILNYVRNSYQDRLLGIFLMALTGVCMVAVMVSLRFLDQRLPSVQAAFLRYLFGLVIIFPFALRELSLRKLKIPIVKHGIRGTLHGFAVVLWFYSVSNIPLTDVTAINGTSIVLAAGAAVNDIIQIMAYATVGSAERHIIKADGGSASSIYTAAQTINGGDANG